MLSPPAQLKPPSPRLRRLLGFVWLACLVLAILVQAGATWRVYVYARAIEPPFAALGLHAYEDQQTGIVLVSFATRPAPAASRDIYWVRSVNGNFALRGAAEDTARLIDGPEGGQVRLGLRTLHETDIEVRLTRSAEKRALVYRHASRTFRNMSQFVDVLVAAFLMFVAWKLRQRKFDDPVAILLSFALLFMSGVGSWMIWYWFELTIVGYLPDLVWLALLLIASPAFPSGRYVPGWARWITVAVPVAMTVFVVQAAFFSSIDALETKIYILNGVLVLASLLCVILRFQFTPLGVERQQMKWASLGLCAGLLLYAAGRALEILWFDLPVPETAQTALSILGFILSRLSYVIIALGLLAPLLDYRLNDADAAIGRSAGYAAVTTLVGVVWAGSAASADTLIKSLTGNRYPGVAAGISTLIALAILAPARTRALAWTEARFQRALVRLRSLPERIARWQLGDDPRAVADRALKAIADGVDATDAALVTGPDGEQPKVIGVHNIDPETVLARLGEGRPQARGADAFPLRVEMADYAGPAMTLLIGRRSDGAYYSRQERAAVSSIAEPLGDALYAVSRRSALNATLTEALAEIKVRLNQMRGKTPPRRHKKAPGAVSLSR